MPPLLWSLTPEGSSGERPHLSGCRGQPGETGYPGTNTEGGGGSEDPHHRRSKPQCHGLESMVTQAIELYGHGHCLAAELARHETPLSQYRTKDGVELLMARAWLVGSPELVQAPIRQSTSRRRGGLIPALG